LLTLNFNTFQYSQILFHLSFTVLFHYQTSKFVDFEGGPPIFKLYMTCTILLV